MSTLSLLESLVAELVESGHAAELADVLRTFAMDKPVPKSWNMTQIMLYMQLAKLRKKAGS